MVLGVARVFAPALADDFLTGDIAQRDSGGERDGRAIDWIAGRAAARALAPARVRRIERRGSINGFAEETEFEVLAEGGFADLIAFLGDIAAGSGALAVIAYTIEPRDRRLSLGARLARLELTDEGGHGPPR